MSVRLVLRWMLLLVASLPLLVAADARASATTSVLEIAPPPAAYGTDATSLRAAAAGELRKVDSASGRGRRRVVVSVALAAPTSDPIVCNVNATVRDARTGSVLAIIESATRASGPLSLEQRKELANRAVKSAVRRVPSVLAATQ